MKTMRLGRSELEVSRIALGCLTYGDPGWRSWVLDPKGARPHFEKALALGINFFDTADMYSNGVSEKVTGALLQELADRDDYVLATKVYFQIGDDPKRQGLSRKHIIAACDDSLERLGLEHIDLYQIHRFDPKVPIEETLEALESLVVSGKVRYLGASSMAAWQFQQMLFAADKNGWNRFISMQNHYNLVYREEEREMIPLCCDQGIGVIPWSPLARGFLTGTRSRENPRPTERSKNDNLADKLYYQEADYQVLDALLKISDQRGRPPTQIALAWLLSVPGVVAPVVGTSKVAHLEDAVAALEIDLSREEIKELEASYQPHSILGHQQPGSR